MTKVTLGTLILTLLSLLGCSASPQNLSRLHSSETTAKHITQDSDLSPLALTPPMGWNSWNKFGCNVNADLLKSTAAAMVTSGMKDAGYQYVVVDDCWQEKDRDNAGNVVPDRQHFAGGIKPIADYIHSLGLKFGIYTDAGRATCQARAGSYGYETKDATAYAAWGVDYVKVDWCNSDGIYPRQEYPIFRDAFKATGWPMVFSICNWGVEYPWLWGPQTGNLWRTTGDISDNWKSMISNLDITADHGAAAGPGHFNDPDMLEVGNGGLTDTENRAHFSLWAEMASPLIAGNDLTNMSETTRAILTNKEVIAVDQDALGLQGTVVAETTAGLQVWSKPLAASGARAVVLFNRTEKSQSITAHWHDIGLASAPAKVRDLWQHADVGTFDGSYSAEVPSHGVVMVTVNGQEPEAPQGTAYLGDMTWVYSASSWGPAERNMSNGERGHGDGRTISLRGQTYSKGVGVHAESVIRVHTAGSCDKFTADVGMDDEVGGNGVVTFEVWGDGQLLYQSRELNGKSALLSIQVNISNIQQIDLRARAGHEETYGHADWANARFECQKH